jgi:hypothetical protein
MCISLAFAFLLPDALSGPTKVLVAWPRAYSCCSFSEDCTTFKRVRWLDRKKQVSLSTGAMNAFRRIAVLHKKVDGIFLKRRREEKMGSFDAIAMWMKPFSIVHPNKLQRNPLKKNFNFELDAVARLAMYRFNLKLGILVRGTFQLLRNNRQN